LSDVQGDNSQLPLTPDKSVRGRSASEARLNRCFFQRLIREALHLTRLF